MNTSHRMLALLACALGASWFGCSDLKDDLPAPASPNVIVHQPAWSDTASAGFHGRVLQASGYSTASCVPCHAQSLAGGTSGVSCYTCHGSFPHASGWTDGASAMSHGRYLKAKGWQIGECASCHGADFRGGTSGASCFSCHPSFPHGSGWIAPASPAFHGTFVRNDSWDMRPCSVCHGEAYDGGATGVSCRQCHTLAAGPENCTTCHGSANAAPPTDLSGTSATTARGVGAHQTHVTAGGQYSALTVSCLNCHAVPGSVYSPGHLDTPLPAEVLLRSPLAVADPTGVPGPPAYSADDLRCRNTFCHGNFSLPAAGSEYAFAYSDSVMVGLNHAALWTGGDAEAACGTCHALPPTGHTPAEITECSACHGDVMNPNGTIRNKAKHINGKINVFSEERPFF